MKRTLLSALGAALLAQAAAAQAPRITPAEIDGHLRFLSSDLLEGRAPATRGGRLTAEYIASQLRESGVEPGVAAATSSACPSTSWARTRPPSAWRRAAAPRPTCATLRTSSSGPAPRRSAARRTARSSSWVTGPRAPEYQWDDFKGMDVRGKVLLVLVNDPPAPADDANRFGGRAMTYYGRWTYKFEEAERQGAAGMLIVHTTEQAGYPWHTVVGSWAKEQRMLPRSPSLPVAAGRARLDHGQRRHGAPGPGRAEPGGPAPPGRAARLPPRARRASR